MNRTARHGVNLFTSLLCFIRYLRHLFYHCMEDSQDDGSEEEIHQEKPCVRKAKKAYASLLFIYRNVQVLVGVSIYQRYRSGLVETPVDDDDGIDQTPRACSQIDRL